MNHRKPSWWPLTSIAAAYVVAITATVAAAEIRCHAEQVIEPVPQDPPPVIRAECADRNHGRDLTLHKTAVRPEFFTAIIAGQVYYCTAVMEFR